MLANDKSIGCSRKTLLLVVSVMEEPSSRAAQTGWATPNSWSEIKKY